MYWFFPVLIWYYLSFISDDDLGCVLLWDQHFARIAKELQSDIQRRAAFVKAFREGKQSKSLEGVHLNSGLRHGESNESLQNFEQSTQENPDEESPENPQCQNEAEQSLQENEMFDSLWNKVHVHVLLDIVLTVCFLCLRRVFRLNFRGFLWVFRKVKQHYFLHMLIYSDFI